MDTTALSPMLTSLDIANFRAFRRLAVQDLTRVSLFVGANNAGKTSILEAAEIAALGSVRGLLRGPIRRDERLAAAGGERSAEVDLGHLFFGHVLRPGNSFEITSEGRRSKRVRCSAVELALESEDDVAQTRLPGLEPEGPSLGVRFESDVQPKAVMFAVSPAGGVIFDVSRRLQATALEAAEPVHFLGTEAVEASRLSYLWDRIVLTPEEEHVAEALRIIEPQLDRIAFLGESSGRYFRSIVVKMAESEQRLPLGSVGDGLKRLLALTLNLIPAQGGLLLVDEIDTGLHYSVMADMWRLVIATAIRLDIQVLATTHSLDCVQSLAWARQHNPEYESEASVHRVERGHDRTVKYSLDEIAVAARNHLEVR
jgi:hypothetical protein